mgnify:CR=1 FL=1
MTVAQIESKLAKMRVMLIDIKLSKLRKKLIKKVL